MALLLVLENSSASHYNDACKPVSVCELLRIENNSSTLEASQDQQPPCAGPRPRPSPRRGGPGSRGPRGQMHLAWRPSSTAFSCRMMAAISWTSRRCCSSEGLWQMRSSIQTTTDRYGGPIPLAPGTPLAGRPARGAGLAGPGSGAAKAPRHGRVHDAHEDRDRRRPLQAERHGLPLEMA